MSLPGLVLIFCQNDQTAQVNATTSTSTCSGGKTGIARPPFQMCDVTRSVLKKKRGSEYPVLIFNRTPVTFLSTFRLTLVKQTRSLNRQPDISQRGTSWAACTSSVGQGTNLVLFQGRYSTRCKMYARIDEEDSDRCQRKVTLLLKWPTTFVTSCRLPYRITRSWNTSLS